MLAKKGLLIALASAGIGAAATLAAGYFTSASWAIPAKDGSSANSTNQMGCLRSSGGMGMGMGMMASMRPQNEPDYLQKMIPHHEEAIATAKLLKAGTNRPEMRKFADDIIRVQSAEIQQMQAWLDRWYPNQKKQAHYMPMMRDLTNLKGDELDRAFLEDMRMHHMGAIMMSHQLLMRNLAKHDEVNKLAESISTSQRNEIHQMQSWLQSWFGATGMMGNHHGHMRGMNNPNRLPLSSVH